MEPRNVFDYMIRELKPGCSERKELEHILQLAHQAWNIAESASRRHAQLATERPTRLDIILDRVCADAGIDFDALDRARKHVDELAKLIGEQGRYEAFGSRDNSVSELRLHVEGVIALVEPLRAKCGRAKR